jgi:hypothetical protein
MKSRKHRHRAKRSRWANAHTPDALRRRRAKRDAAREALAATLPPIPDDPVPLSVWQTVIVLGTDGREMHRITLYVPTAGHRCDQHATDIDGARELLTATAIGRRVAWMICKRPSHALLADARRECWA